VSPNVLTTIKSRIRWARHLERVRGIRISYNILVRKLEWMRTLTIVRCKRENVALSGCRGSKMESMEWIHLAKDRIRYRALVYTVMNLRVS
jgi:hypothetical protein